jgi:hypothetical protein
MTVEERVFAANAQTLVNLQYIRKLYSEHTMEKFIEPMASINQ